MSERVASPPPLLPCVWVPDHEENRLLSGLAGGVDGLFEAGRTAGHLSTDPVRVHVGQGALHEALSADVPLVYLPFTGLSAREVVQSLGLRRDAPTFFFHLFEPKDLAVHRGEGNPVQLLNQTVRDGPGLDESPYLDLLNEGTPDRLSGWVASVIAVAAARRQLREKECEGMRLSGVARHFVCAHSATTSIESASDLARAILYRRQASALLDRVEASRTVEEDVRQELERAHLTAEALATEAYRRTLKDVHGTDFVYSLGDEILPDLQRTLAQVEQFADEIAGEAGSLGDIAVSLQGRLRQKRPVLALLGTFSSGKTTLLNTLLFGKDAVRAFPTKRVSNTSVVFELAAAEGDEEHARFVYRDHISHVVFDGSQSGLTAAKNTKTIQRLMETGVCRSPRLTVDLDVVGMSKPETVAHEGARNVSRALSDIDRAAANGGTYDDGLTRGRLRGATYLAKVDHDRLRAHLGDRLPDRVDLSDEEGWARFIGGDEETKSAESDEAPFLVERAEVFLHNDLLKLTTVADTPGTGSFNDRHDTVTQQYLGNADAILFLLPTKDAHADRVRRLLETLRAHFEERYKGNVRRGLSDVAFVVNVFAGLSRDDAVRRIAEAERTIQDLFGLTEAEWQHLQDESPSFFAVQLKHVEEGSNQAHLYNYPSLAALRKWISQRLRSGAYAARVRSVLTELDEGWRKRRVALQKEIDELHGSERNRREFQRKARQLEGTLHAEAESHRRYLSQFYRDLSSGDQSLHNTALSQIQSARSHPPKHADGLAELKCFLKDQVSVVNARLSEFVDAEVGDDWLQASHTHLESVGARPPAVPPPRPEDSETPWYKGTRMKWPPLAGKFGEAQQKWPNWFARGIGKIKSFFGGTDPRAALVGAVAAEWESQFNRIGNGLGDFVGRLDTYLVTSLAKVNERLDQRIADLENPDDPDRKQALEAERESFERHTPTRERLIAQLQAHIST